MFRSVSELSVLIVDDNAFIRKLIRSMLRQIPTGEIVEFEDGEAALAYLETRHVDIVLLDWVMPDFGGADFLKALAAKREKTGMPIQPVVVVTANASRAVVLQAAKLGASGVIAKPVSVSILRDRIYTVINREARQIENMSKSASLNFAPGPEAAKEPQQQPVSVSENISVAQEVSVTEESLPVREFELPRKPTPIFQTSPKHSNGEDDDEDDIGAIFI